MSLQTIYKWEVYCTTTSSYQEVWATIEPTTCPINNTHSISINPGPRIIDHISESEVKIKEEDGVTQQVYKLQGFKLDIPSGNVGDVTTTTHQWNDYPISLLDGWFYSGVDQLGDEINVTAAENKIIGAIGAPVYSGNTQITVSGTVLENLYLGYEFGLTDGGNVNMLGEVTSINSVDSIVTVQNAATNTFSPLSPTYVMMTAKVLEDIYISCPCVKYGFAEKKVGGKYIPAGIDLNIKYTNNSGNSKIFYYNIAYLY